MNLESNSKILPLATVIERVRAWRAEGKTIVTANGAFDIMHAGHVSFLESAAEQGDVLVIGINSDSSVRAYKSPLRPIISQAFRAAMVAALGCVDMVFLFDETDPRAWLRLVKPDVHVNGAEYGANCIEREAVEEGGGRIHLVTPSIRLSTSAIVERIINVYTAEREKLDP
jgi:rfaE bifunctional protein nucleotidyltransferase chain/domain